MSTKFEGDALIKMLRRVPVVRTAYGRIDKHLKQRVTTNDYKLRKKAAFGLAGAVLALSGCNSSNTADNSALTITSTNATATIASAV